MGYRDMKRDGSAQIYQGKTDERTDPAKSCTECTEFFEGFECTESSKCTALASKMKTRTLFNSQETRYACHVPTSSTC